MLYIIPDKVDFVLCRSNVLCLRSHASHSTCVCVALPDWAGEVFANTSMIMMLIFAVMTASS